MLNNEFGKELLEIREEENHSLKKILNHAKKSMAVSMLAKVTIQIAWDNYPAAKDSPIIDVLDNAVIIFWEQLFQLRRVLVTIFFHDWPHFSCMD